MRLFIGMTVPDSLRERIQAAWASLKTCPVDCRPIDPQNWHFTLAFLSEVKEEHLDALEHLIEKAVERPPKGSFLFTEFQTFPPKHPNYVVARAHAEPAREWATFIEGLRDMVSVATPDIDRKPWVPHVSVARARKNRLLPLWNHAIEPFSWKPSELTLVRSEPGQNGSRYTDLHVFPLDV